MRQIILDTETTGIDPKEGHRVIEIGCMEMIDRKITGRHFHKYINPEREVEEEALLVHGISNEFLKDKPTFKTIVAEFLEFINGAELIIHNAPFDVGFLDYEFKLADKKIGKITKYCKIFDTLVLARKTHPGQRNSLDALCKRYAIDNSNRDLHGALIDTELLAKVYLIMTGGQGSLFADSFSPEKKIKHAASDAMIEREARGLLKIIKANKNELKAHDEFISKLKKESGVDLWG